MELLLYGKKVKFLKNTIAINQSKDSILIFGGIINEKKQQICNGHVQRTSSGYRL